MRFGAFSVRRCETRGQSCERKLSGGQVGRRFLRIIFRRLCLFATKPSTFSTGINQTLPVLGPDLHLEWI